MHMHEILRATKLIADLEGELEKVPEHREGIYLRYEMVNAGMAAFAMFFVQIVHVLDTMVSKSYHLLYINFG